MVYCTKPIRRDIYAEGYFANGMIVKYDTIPGLIGATKKSDMIELAREFVGSDVRGFAAVSSVEKALITTLDSSLNF